MQRLFVHLLSDEATPKSLHAGLLVIIPKPIPDEVRGDKKMLQRAAKDTRPITLRNSDAKGLASAIAFKCRGGRSIWADEAQRGFVRGRQGLANLVEADARARIATAMVEAHPAPASAAAALGPADRDPSWAAARELDMTEPFDEPLVILFDFLQAFPSVAHQLVLLAIDATEPPEGARRYFRRLVAPAKVTVRLRSTTEIEFSVDSGVAQGCPLSGQAFVIAMNPCMKLVRRCVAPHVTMRGFADDLAAIATQTSVHLRQLGAAFRCLAQASGLSLKAAKCKVVPLSPASQTAEARERIRAMVAGIVPEWSEVVVVDSGVYLGLRIGPGATVRDQWRDPMAKFWRRADQIASAGLAATRGFTAYSQQVGPTLS